MSVRTSALFVMGIIVLAIVFIALFAFVLPVQKRAINEQFSACEKSFNDEKYQEAITLLETFIKKYPRSKKTPDAYYYLAMSKQYTGSDEEIPLWEKIVSKYPKSKHAADAYFWVGFWQDVRKDYDKAMDNFKIVIDKYPDDPIVAGALLGMGKIYQIKGQESEAVAYFQSVVDKYPKSGFGSDAEGRLGLATVGRYIQKNLKPYKVQKGDSLVTIANKFHITPELITRLSDLKSNALNVGQSVNVIDGSNLNVLINLTECKLYLKSGDNIIRRYPVCVGKKETPTPTGSYNVTDKAVDPTWFSTSETGGKGAIPGGDPRNELGSRWIGFKPSYGVHGTIFPESIGKAESHGCVRMNNKDVEELYGLVVVGTPVKIIN
ncbi:MAG: Tetratricopeptide repeat protein [Candidatus Poribacteria bacterium]|nr:Tetratricopeptide repeat protein [Candidatus Poribacteria bacterium]